MHPSIHAAMTPHQAALIMGESGKIVTFEELEAGSNQAAQLFRSEGLQSGGVVALLLENHSRYLELAWAAQRAGLYVVGISWRLTAPEVEYIVRDSGAGLVITSAGVGSVTAELPARLPQARLFMLDGEAPGYLSWEAEVASFPLTPIVDQRAGSDMLYSSGTTGRPRGIRLPLASDGDICGPTSLSLALDRLFGIGPETIYLCPAPLYHSAALRWCMSVQKVGGTVVVMKKFDPEGALALIERHEVNLCQFVPTHFIRLLKLPDEVRRRYDLSSLKVAVHAAAPCPIPVKQAMIDWWGPILFEYYAGTEGNGMTMIDSPQWVERPGSVGKSVVGTARVCDEDGEPLPPRAIGTIYFENGPSFAYHNDPEKTASCANKYGWTTLGDVGWMDEEGYLYLTDRKSFTIISGGVNIYPQEIENLLVLHAKVQDAAVIGAPHPEMGKS